MAPEHRGSVEPGAQHPGRCRRGRGCEGLEGSFSRSRGSEESGVRGKGEDARSPERL